MGWVSTKLEECTRQQSEAQVSGDLEIGQMIPGKGIFMGVWEAKNRRGKSLGKKFRRFVAPEDLMDDEGKKVLWTFREAAQQVAGLRNWHGHDGADFKDEADFYKALKEGRGIGKWFIPPSEFLIGIDRNGDKVSDDHLYAHSARGNLKGTFATAEDSGRGFWYGSCTEPARLPSFVWAACFLTGDDGWTSKTVGRLNFRPFRLEELVP